MGSGGESKWIWYIALFSFGGIILSGLLSKLTLEKSAVNAFLDFDRSLSDFVNTTVDKGVTFDNSSSYFIIPGLIILAHIMVYVFWFLFWKQYGNMSGVTALIVTGVTVLVLHIIKFIWVDSGDLSWDNIQGLLPLSGIITLIVHLGDFSVGKGIAQVVQNGTNMTIDHVKNMTTNYTLDLS